MYELLFFFWKEDGGIIKLICITETDCLLYFTKAKRESKFQVDSYRAYNSFSWKAT